MGIAGILPDLVERSCDSFVEIVRGRLQLFTNKQLLTRLQTKKMARPTGFTKTAQGLFLPCGLSGLRRSVADRYRDWSNL